CCTRIESVKRRQRGYRRRVRCLDCCKRIAFRFGENRPRIGRRGMRHFPSTRFATGAPPDPVGSGGAPDPSDVHPAETVLPHNDPRPPRAARPRALKLLVICGIALIAATMLATGALVLHFRDRVLSDTERELTNTALILAE